MATDSTGLKVLVEKLTEAHSDYLEHYRNSEFAIAISNSPSSSTRRTKHGEHVESKLATFRGAPTADAEHRFKKTLG